MRFSFTRHCRRGWSFYGKPFDREESYERGRKAYSPNPPADPRVRRCHGRHDPLTAGIRTLAVNGRPARVFSLLGPNGKPGITLSPGERFHVDLVNRAGTSTIIHWHGQLPPWTQDGFPWPQTPPIPAGDTHSYDYAPIAGTFWMHSHQGMQEQSLMTAAADRA